MAGATQRVTQGDDGDGNNIFYVTLKKPFLYKKQLVIITGDDGDDGDGKKHI